MDMAIGRPVRFAIIGCGGIAGAHIRAVAAVEGARVTWCQDIDEDRAQSAAGLASVRHTCDYDEVLAAEDVDVVLLCLPHHLHEPFSIQAAEAGKHILVEKPMALDEAEALRMVEAAAAAKVVLCVGQSTRCMASLRQARHILLDGTIGEVRHLIHQRLFNTERVSTEWRRVGAECGGLYLPLFGSHDIDAALWLLSAASGNAAAPSKVHASVRSFSQAADAESDGFIGLDFADGRLATFQFSMCSHLARTETILVGSDATLSVERNRVLLNGKVAELDRPYNEHEDSFAEQIRQLVAGLCEKGAPLPAPGTQVLTVVRTLDLAKQAAETGQPQVY